MKKLKILLLATVGLVVVSACDELLDIEPQYAQDAESYFNTPEDYENALIGAYDLLQTSYTSFWIGEIASDNAIAGGESVNDSQALHEIDEMTHNGVNSLLRDVLRFNYAGITRVNYIFENAGNLEFERKTELLAEAAFLRAYYYFELVKIFGDVPLVVDRRLGIEEATSIARTPAADVYVQIEKDLNNAANTLAWTAAEKGRITKGAALGLLGRVLLYQDKFGEAATVLDQVINEGPYSSITVSSSEEYAALFSVAEEGNSESVFEIQYSGLDGGGYECLVCLEGNLTVGFQGIRQYEGPVYGDGNSYNLPTKALYDFFPETDIRRDGTILDIEAFITDQGDDGIKYAIGGGGHTGYYNNKYIKRQGELGLPDDDLTSPVNYRAIRYPDVLLMAAEAHNRKSGADDAQAQTYLNEVRTRVGLGEITSTGAALLDAIWTERRLELSGEGLRFFDLVRTGQANNDIIPGFTAGKNELFPIPQVEIDLSGGNWDQNDGYNE